MAYEDLPNLKPCTTCHGRSYWFDGMEWNCSTCQPCPQQYSIQCVLDAFEEDWLAADPKETAPTC